MEFTKYTAPAQGYRANQEGCIAIQKHRIGLGTLKLPFEYAVISFDKDNDAIRFTEGLNGDGFKVQKGTKTYWLGAKSFTKLNILPMGIYERIDKDKQDEFTFVLRGSYPRPVEELKGEVV